MDRVLTWGYHHWVAPIRSRPRTRAWLDPLVGFLGWSGHARRACGVRACSVATVRPSGATVYAGSTGPVRSYQLVSCGGLLSRALRPLFHGLSHHDRVGRS